jgi:preprotein translocase subunit SecY
MFEGLIAAFKNSDLRKKILFTVMILLLYRVGALIPVPFVDTSMLGTVFQNSGLTDMLNIMSGGALQNAALFAMGISPYINASIIVQLLTIAIPALEKLKNQEDGQKKINKITRYLTVALGLVMGYGYYTILDNAMGILTQKTFFTGLIVVLAFTAGSALVMWMAEKIDEHGIGNGISMILFAGILSQGPAIVNWVVTSVKESQFVGPILVLVIGLLMIAGIVWVNGAERRIPVQYAKRVVGRKMYGGNQTHLPMKVLMTGVMPIIFASSFCMLPSTIASFMAENGFTKWVNEYFTTDKPLYGVLFFILIIFFNYFYVSVSYDPVEISNNLQKNGGSIPGIRPGEPTVNYIKKSLNKITLLGAIFLGFIAIIPMIATVAFGVNFALSGNSMLIVVSIILETSMVLESQISMRHYKGFLE